MHPKMLAIDAADFLNVSVQSIHKQIKTKKLPFEKSQNRVYFGYSTAKQIFKLKFFPKVFAMQIVKGGTGKTSLVHSIAIRANLYGARVLCIDMDQQGNLTQAFKVNPEKTPVLIDVLNENIPLEDSIVNITEGLDLIPSRIENAVLDNVIILKRLPIHRIYKDKIEGLQEKNLYDLILIDCPPALGQSVAAAAFASHCVIAPVTPEKFSLSGLKISKQEIETIARNYKLDIPLRIILNKFDGRTTLSHETLSLLIKHETFGSKLFKTYIRVNQEFSNVIAKGTSIFDAIRSTPAKEDIDLLTRELLEIDNNHEQETLLLGSLGQRTSTENHIET